MWTSLKGRWHYAQQINVFYKNNYTASMFPDVVGEPLTVSDKGVVRLFDNRYDHREYVFGLLEDSLQEVCVDTLQPERAKAIGRKSIVDDAMELQPALEIGQHWPPEQYQELNKELVTSFKRHEPFYRELAPRIEKFYSGVNYASKRIDDIYTSTNDLTNENVVEVLRTTHHAYANFRNELVHINQITAPPELDVGLALNILNTSMTSLNDVINTLL